MDVGGKTDGLSREEIAQGAGDGARSTGSGQGAPALPRIIPNKNRRLQVAPTRRRLFDKGARKVFLEWFAGTGNLSLSARKAGFHYRTVLRHRAEDDVFREEFDLALSQSEARIEAWLTEAKDKGLDASEPSGFDPGGVDLEALGLDGSGPGDGEAEEDGHAPAHLTPEMAMQWLKANRQRAAHAAAVAAGDGSGRGLKVGRAPARASNEEVFEALLRSLHSLGVRMEADEARRLAREEMEGPHRSDGGGAGLGEIPASAGTTSEGRNGEDAR
ncbi:MAG: hypothetical protein JO013_13365 [Alphaproteobacteria bacterium]|nr:hypothetical protein [Alphaproteobacteria bacterium]